MSWMFGALLFPGPSILVQKQMGSPSTAVLLKEERSSISARCHRAAEIAWSMVFTYTELP